jgi:hypothetical protein
MTPQEDYVGRCMGLLISLDEILTPDEAGWAQHLIDHGEPAEGMRALAWFIVEGDKRVPAETIGAIRELSSGLVREEDMPPNFDDYASDRDV